MSTAGPQKFEKHGKTFIGHAIAIRMPSGSEIIIFAPTIDEAEIAATSFGNIEINREEIKRAALGPVSLLSGAQIAEGE